MPNDFDFCRMLMIVGQRFVVQRSMFHQHFQLTIVTRKLERQEHTRMYYKSTSTFVLLFFLVLRTEQCPWVPEQAGENVEIRKQ